MIKVNPKIIRINQNYSIILQILTRMRLLRLPRLQSYRYHSYIE